MSGGLLPATELSPTRMQMVYTAPTMTGPCFGAGTPVLMADGTWQPIETIGAGAAVLAFDERGQQVVTTRVSELLDHAPEPIYRATIEDLDRDLLVTPNHPFYSGGKWRRIGELAPQSELFYFDAKRGVSAPRRLLALEPTGQLAPVFNFEVEEAHTYFVDGLLVHNGGNIPNRK